MSETELKPCPFCGSADAAMQQCQAEHYVQCLECEGATALFSSRREARELWNRRAALTPPEGYVLVSVEPTEKMAAVAQQFVYSGFDWPKAVYRAMVAARPGVSGG